jgi:hypothetical protein
MTLERRLDITPELILAALVATDCPGVFAAAGIPAWDARPLADVPPVTPAAVAAVVAVVARDERVTTRSHAGRSFTRRPLRP